MQFGIRHDQNIDLNHWELEMVVDWLEKNGLSSYINHFIDNNVQLDRFGSLNYDGLIQLGIQSAKDLSAILIALKNLKLLVNSPCEITKNQEQHFQNGENQAYLDPFALSSSRADSLPRNKVSILTETCLPKNTKKERAIKPAIICTDLKALSTMEITPRSDSLENLSNFNFTNEHIHRAFSLKSKGINRTAGLIEGVIQSL